MTGGAKPKSAKEKGGLKKAVSKRKRRVARSDPGIAYERKLMGEVGMNPNKITKRVQYRVDHTDPTHWQSGYAAQAWKRYDKGDKVNVGQTSRMNTTPAYRWANWPPNKFLNDRFAYVPWVKMIRSKNPHAAHKKIVKATIKGKVVARAVPLAYKPRKAEKKE